MARKLLRWQFQGPSQWDVSLELTSPAETGQGWLLPGCIPARIWAPRTPWENYGLGCQAHLRRTPVPDTLHCTKPAPTRGKPRVVCRKCRCGLRSESATYRPVEGGKMNSGPLLGPTSSSGPSWKEKVKEWSALWIHCVILSLMRTTFPTLSCSETSLKMKK